MARELLELINLESGDKFAFLRLNYVKVYVRKKLIEIGYLFPESMTFISDDDKSEIEAYTKKILNSSANIAVKFTRSHFDKDYFLNLFYGYLCIYPAIASTIEKSDIVITENQDEKLVELNLKPNIFDYCVEKNIKREIDIWLSHNYCEKINVSLCSTKELTSEDFVFDAPPIVTTELENPQEGRFIAVQNVDSLVGQIIYDKAIYIEDATKVNPSVTVCGTIVQLAELARKPTANSKEEKKYYRFTLEDYTGRIDCLYFPNKYTKDKITLLQSGKEVIVRGALEKDNRDSSKLVFFIKDISYCTLPKDFTLNRIKRKVESEYKTITPYPYVSSKQVSLFEKQLEKITPSLKNKTFVVFDLETTGLNPYDNMIIEIAGVKLFNGKITEVFTSLIDPQVAIPDRITSLTGISNSDVAGKPKIEDVMPDFYKFTQDAVLVAQNISFDYSFIAAHGKKQNIYFDNERMDTLVLAHKYLPGLSQYKLENICEGLGVKLENAHRAVDDALATAEVFIKLIEKMDENG